MRPRYGRRNGSRPDSERAEPLASMRRGRAGDAPNVGALSAFGIAAVYGAPVGSAFRVLGHARLPRSAARAVAAAPGQRIAQQVFDLGIGTAQFLRGEALDLAPQGGVDAQQERFLVGRS